MDVQKLLDRVSQNLSVTRAFGTAYEKDGSLIIPVALVAGGGGAGEGSEGVLSTTSEEGDDAGDSRETVSKAEPSSGSGGGFGSAVVPVGVYVVKDERVRWIPAVNANLVIIVVFVILRMILRARYRAQRKAH